MGSFKTVLVCVILHCLVSSVICWCDKKGICYKSYNEAPPRCKDIKSTPDACDIADTDLNIFYPESHTGVKCGEKLTEKQSSRIPFVQFSDAQPTERYVLVMVDRDAPSRNNPTMRFWKHWIVADIRGSQLKWGSLDHSVAIIRYEGPTPPSGSGAHRYQFFLFLQPEGASASTLVKYAGSSTHRDRFDVDTFIAKNELDCPIAGFQFTTENL